MDGENIAMSNTDWYAALEASQPWKAFNAYAKDVRKVFDLSHASQRDAADGSTSVNRAPTAKLERKALDFSDLSGLDSLVSECTALYQALPIAEKQARRYCYGLPRKYPKFWMVTPHSNSLMIEYRLVQAIPSNGLKSWKE